MHSHSTIRTSCLALYFQARGRTTILRVNYRNTDKIINIAYRFAEKYFKTKESDEDHIPLIRPKTGDRKGKAPSIGLYENFKEDN
ncbi:MAG: hypothetical protein L3J51_04810 [Cocleimonas sp.]|nr:hypothetical protein [Cocleimonas sp.]